MQGFIDQATVDFITTNGQHEGDLATRMGRGAAPAVRFDPGLMRPWMDGDGGKYLDVATGETVVNADTGEAEAVREPIPLQRLISNGLAPPIYNSTALPRLVWERIDRNVIKASRDRLQAWADLSAANTYGGFDGMAVTALVRDTMTDPGTAHVDMNGLTEGPGDAPLFTPDVVALPMTHSGFFLDSRTLATSRNSGTPLDTTLSEACARRVSEEVEKMTIGVTDMSTFVIGSATDFTRRGIYGFKTQPDRITYTSLTAVATASTQNVVDEVIAMVSTAYAQKFYGPFVLYYNSSYDTLMNQDYWRYVTSGGAAPTKTLKQRLQEIEGVSKVQRLDLAGSTQNLLLVQMSSETVRAINGMNPTTVMWEERGGALIKFRVAAIHVPDLRSQYVGTSTTSRKCGIVQGSVA